MAKLHKLCYLSDLLPSATLAEPYCQIKMDFTFTLNLNLSKLICICVPKHFQSVTLYFPRVPQILLSVEFSFLLGSTGVIRGLNIFMSRSQEALPKRKHHLNNRETVFVLPCLCVLVFLYLLCEPVWTHLLCSAAVMHFRKIACMNMCVPWNMNACLLVSIQVPAGVCLPVFFPQ